MTDKAKSRPFHVIRAGTLGLAIRKNDGERWTLAGSRKIPPEGGTPAG